MVASIETIPLSPQMDKSVVNYGTYVNKMRHTNTPCIKNGTQIKDKFKYLNTSTQCFRQKHLTNSPEIFGIMQPAYDEKYQTEPYSQLKKPFHSKENITPDPLNDEFNEWDQHSVISDYVRITECDAFFTRECQSSVSEWMKRFCHC